MLSLAVILLNYRRPQNMGRIIDAAREGLPGVPIYILDQAEQDDFALQEGESWSDVRLERSRTNAGAGARITLAASLPFDLFLSIDDDTFLTGKQISRLAEFLRAEPDRAHGVTGERLELSRGEIRFKSIIRRVDLPLSNLNQVYAFSREQAKAAIALSARIGFRSWTDVVVGNDIILSCASAKLPLCHDLGFIGICPTSYDEGVAVSRRVDFAQRRAAIAAKLLAARAIGVFKPLTAYPGVISDPIPGKWQGIAK